MDIYIYRQTDKEKGKEREMNHQIIRNTFLAH
jgi:hypothetical protein